MPAEILRFRPSLETRLQSTQSVSEWFRKTAWNVFVGTLLIAGGIWAILNVPGILPAAIHAPAPVQLAGSGDVTTPWRVAA